MVLIKSISTNYFFLVCNYKILLIFLLPLKFQVKKSNYKSNASIHPKRTRILPFPKFKILCLKNLKAPRCGSSMYTINNTNKIHTTTTATPPNNSSWARVVLELAVGIFKVGCVGWWSINSKSIAHGCFLMVPGAELIRPTAVSCVDVSLAFEISFHGVAGLNA